MSTHYFRGVTVVTVTMPEIVRPKAEGLAVYWVLGGGSGICVAAYSYEQALELSQAWGGGVGDEVWLASTAHLDREWQSLDGRSLGTLRSVLGSMCEPGCIVAPGYWRGLDG